VVRKYLWSLMLLPGRDTGNLFKSCFKPSFYEGHWGHSQLELELLQLLFFNEGIAISEASGTDISVEAMQGLLIKADEEANSLHGYETLGRNARIGCLAKPGEEELFSNDAEGVCQQKKVVSTYCAGHGDSWMQDRWQLVCLELGRDVCANKNQQLMLLHLLHQFGH